MSDKTTQIKAILNKDLENLLVQTSQINDYLGGARISALIIEAIKA